MRKSNLIQLFIFIFALFFTFDVFASTNVEKRSKDDLKVHSSIKVTKKNIDNILSTPKVDEHEKVYDFANLFTEIEESNIYHKIKDFINKTNYDLAVVTIHENNKGSEMEYADDFYDYNYFGFDDSFSGLLILIDMDNRGIYISTNGYAIKMYDDYRIDSAIDRGFDSLINAYYSESINDIIYSLDYFYDQDYPSGNKDLIIDGVNVYYKKTIMDYIKIPLLVSTFMTFIITLVLYFSTRLKIKANNVVDYIVKEQDVNIDKRFITTTVTRKLKNTESSGSGSFGGGSSHHRSSSGRSHGGGGRRF